MMDIHSEVSTGVVDINGIPSQTTTEVTTRLLVASGQTIFIGGLIKQTLNETQAGIPILRRIPGLGLLFSSREMTSINTETVIVITPRVVGDVGGRWDAEAQSEIESLERQLQRRTSDIDRRLDETFIQPVPLTATDSIAESN